MSESKARMKQHMEQAHRLIEKLMASEGISNSAAHKAVMTTLKGAAVDGFSLYDTEQFLAKARQIARALDEMGRGTVPPPRTVETWRPRRIG